MKKMKKEQQKKSPLILVIFSLSLFPLLCGEFISIFFFHYCDVFHCEQKCVCFFEQTSDLKKGIKVLKKQKILTALSGGWISSSNLCKVFRDSNENSSSARTATAAATAAILSTTASSLLPTTSFSPRSYNSFGNYCNSGASNLSNESIDGNILGKSLNFKVELNSALKQK